MTADLDKVFKAWPTLAGGCCSIVCTRTTGKRSGQLCQHLDMTRQAVTKHLKLLEAASLVVTLAEGREKLHYLNPVPIHEIAERWIGKYERADCGPRRAQEETRRRLPWLIRDSSM